MGLGNDAHSDATAGTTEVQDGGADGGAPDHSLLDARTDSRADAIDRDASGVVDAALSVDAPEPQDGLPPEDAGVATSGPEGGVDSAPRDTAIDPDRGPSPPEPPPEPIDAGPVEAAPDGAGARPSVDLSGLYAVVWTVQLSNHASYAVGDELSGLIALEWIDESRYHLLMMDHAGQPVFEVEPVNVAQPTGPQSGELRYRRPAFSVGDDCQQIETVTDLCAIEGEGPFRLTGPELREVHRQGAGCEAEVFNVLLDVAWNPLPR